MEINCGISKLMELIFGRKPTIPDEMFSHFSIPSSWLNQDFSKKLEFVLHCKKKFCFFCFQKNFHKDSLKFIHSHELYLKSVLTVCRCEYESSKNGFEKFLNVCAAVNFLNEEILLKTGVNFCGLNPDIIIMFYESDAIQSPFIKRKDFSQFVGFICTHKYLKWNWDTFDHTSPDGVAASFLLDKRIIDDMRRFGTISEEVKSTIGATVTAIAENILSNTSIELPTLPSKSVPVENLVESTKKEMVEQTKEKSRVETALTNGTSHGNSSSNSDSKQISYAAQEENIEWHENIVQAVIRHNHSNISRHEHVKSQKQIEAEATLDDLKTSIKSLIGVLDECKLE